MRIRNTGRFLGECLRSVGEVIVLYKPRNCHRSRGILGCGWGRWGPMGKKEYPLLLMATTSTTIIYANFNLGAGALFPGAASPVHVRPVRAGVPVRGGYTGPCQAVWRLPGRPASQQCQPVVAWHLHDARPKCKGIGTVRGVFQIKPQNYLCRKSGSLERCGMKIKVVPRCRHFLDFLLNNFL